MIMVNHVMSKLTRSGRACGDGPGWHEGEGVYCRVGMKEGVYQLPGWHEREGVYCRVGMRPACYIIDTATYNVMYAVQLQCHATVHGWHWQDK